MKELIYSKSKDKHVKSKSFIVPCPLYRLPREGVAHIKDGSSCLKSSGLKVSLPTANDLIRKIFNRCTQLHRLYLILDLVKWTTKNSQHNYFVFISLIDFFEWGSHFIALANLKLIKIHLHLLG